MIVPTETTPGATLARIARAFLPAVTTRTAAARPLGGMDQQQLQVAAYERVQEWTRQAAEAVRHNGTLNNHLTSISSLAASGIWKAVRVQGELVEGDADFRVARFVESLATLDIGRCVRRHETVGAHWIIPWPDNESLIRWDEASTSELMLPVDPRKPPEITRHRSVGSLPLYPTTLDPAKRPALIRVWRPDDEWRDMAWSPVASVLHHIEALHLMNLAEMALDRNRLASAGLLFLPNDIAGIDQKDPEKSSTFRSITKAATSAIADPHSVSSVVPVFLTGPGASGEQIRHLVTERREDPAAFQARRESHLRELARALSSPAGRVLGTEDQAKYANAAAMDFDTLRTYLPAVTTDISKAINQVYRHTREHWGLPVRGYELRLDFDHLKPQEDRTEKGLKLREAGVLTAEGLAEMADIPEEWRLKTDTPEYQRWEAEQKTRTVAPVQVRSAPVSIESAPNGKPPEGTPAMKVASVAVGELKVGDHVKHDTTGAYLGKVTDPDSTVVHFDGPRTRDGIPVAIATRYEVDKMTADEIAAVLGVVPEPTETESIAAALGLPHVAAAVIPESFGQLLAGLGDQALDENVKVNLSDVGGPMFVGLGLKRNEMPQLDGAALDEFLASLTVGVKVETEADPLEFLSSQSQLSASKARGMSLADNLDEIMSAPIPVSNDNYIVDGHHRWVAAIMDERTFTVARIDLPIGDILDLAKEFSGKTKKFTAAASPGVNWTPVLAALAAVDRRLHDRIAAAAEHAMETALRKAGVKAFNKATASQKRLCEDVPRQRVVATLGQKAVAALGLTEDDLLANTLDDLLPIVTGYIVAAQIEAVTVLAAIDPTIVIPAAATDWTASALRALTDGFRVSAIDALHDPDPLLKVRGEVPLTPTKIPNRVITDVVAKAGGVKPVGPDSVLIGGPGQGATLGTVTAASPEPPRLVYVWHHGSPAVPFPPHAALDGQRFASMDDARLLKDLGDPEVNWLGGTIFHVGDHKGCTCRLELQLDSETS